MEINPSAWIIKGDQEQQLELPSGFRFHPTDDEIITYYLLPKTLDSSFVSLAIGEADLRKLEPWELPYVAKMGEEEWYLFCVREKRYPTGKRANRGTKAGYWKATGKDKEIYSGKFLVGMRKTLVFYQGRAPKGVKSNWVMHEYRLEGKYCKDNLPQSAQSDWVISRVFHKNQSGKKTHISALPDPNSLPPLTDYTNFTTKSSTLEFADSLMNQETSIFTHLIEDNGDENNLLASLKKEPLEDTGQGYLCGDLLDDHDLFDIDCFFNY